MQAQNRTVLLAHTQFLLVLFSLFLHLKKPKGRNVVLLLITIEEKGQENLQEYHDVHPQKGAENSY